MNLKALTLAVAGTSLLALAGAGMAAADPSPSTDYRQLAGVGSDTTMNVMNGLANVVVDGSSNKILASWDAVGSSTITTKGAGALATAASAGGTSITTSAALVPPPVVGSKLTLDSGVAGSEETVTVSGVSGATYTVSALALAHASGATVRGNCTLSRPSGSGNGRKILDASIRGVTSSINTANTNKLGGCADFARSSNYSSGLMGGEPAGSNEGTFVPFATDALTFATLSTSNVARRLSVASLKSIYQCSFHAPGGTQTIQPLLPQFGSGTRQFWLQSIGLDQNAVIPAPGSGEGTGTQLGDCVKDKAADGVTDIVEHDGTFVTNANQIIAFSTAQYIAQISGNQTPNNLGRIAIGSIAPTATPTQFRSSLYINPGSGSAAFPFTRQVFNVIPTSLLGDPLYQSVFTGTNGQLGATNNSQICQHPEVIQNFGFNLDPKCGDTSQKSG